MKNYVSKILFSVATILLLSCSQSGKRRKEIKIRQITSQNLTKEISTPDKTGISLEELYQRNKEAVFIIYTSNGEKSHQGSGFFLSADGIGVSNYHVFEGTFKGKEVIKLLNGNQYQIKEVIASSKELDYIVFRVTKSKVDDTFFFVHIAENIPLVGESVFAIGNPKGLESTLSTGIVSSLRESDHLIQTTAEITHESSGGPLFNMNGEVIGITSSGMREAHLNFAIDIRLLNRLSY